ncbi:MAG: ATP-binding cassette domain-containing protein [Lachnospiraceae bacterium]|nr:ATP-binding cassette domain-containing protein [Lachnospiraceae bacterium]
MKINNLTVSYGEKKVLDNLSLEFGNGITCLMGESGRGKTTLLHTIAGLIKPVSGDITDGPKKPALMFQDDRLLPWFTVIDNITVVNDNREKALELLSLMELDGCENKMPSELSGGMRRRVSLARALAFDSDMIILDEPFKGLDAALTGRIAEVIKKSTVPVIIATHDKRDIGLLGADMIEMP